MGLWLLTPLQAAQDLLSSPTWRHTCCGFSLKVRGGPGSLLYLGHAWGSSHTLRLDQQVPIPAVAGVLPCTKNSIRVAWSGPASPQILRMADGGIGTQTLMPAAVPATDKHGILCSWDEFQGWGKKAYPGDEGGVWDGPALRP